MGVKSAREMRISEKSDATLQCKIMNIYPNPAKNFINVEISKEDLNNCSLKILDMLGTVHIEQIMNKPNISLNLSNLANGSYIIQLSTANRVLESQIITVK